MQRLTDFCVSESGQALNPKPTVSSTQNLNTNIQTTLIFTVLYTLSNFTPWACCDRLLCIRIAGQALNPTENLNPNIQISLIFTEFYAPLKPYSWPAIMLGVSRFEKPPRATCAQDRHWVQPHGGSASIRIVGYGHGLLGFILGGSWVVISGVISLLWVLSSE